MDVEASKSVFYFVWHRTVDGHEWLKNPDIIDENINYRNRFKLGTFLLPKRGWTQRYLYDPLAAVPVGSEESPLFIRFAQLNEWNDSELPDRIMEFADNYGMLGVGHPILRKEPGDAITIGKSEDAKKNTQNWPDIDEGENIQLWKEEIRDMAGLVQTWALLKDPHEFDALRKHIVWLDGGQSVRWVYNPDVGLSQIVARPRDLLYSYPISNRLSWPDVFEVWEKNEKTRLKTLGDRQGWVRGPAEYYLHRRLTTKLRRAVSPAFLLSAGTGKSSPHLIPEHLLGALWLQFFQAIVGETWIVQCEYCHKWMDVSSRRKRKEVTRCRRCGRREDTRRSRARIQQAHDLYNKGVNIEEIARKVGSNPKTVKGWIDKGPSTTK